MKPKEKTKLALETFDKLMTIIDRWKGLDLLDLRKSKMDSARLIRNFPFYRNVTMFPFDKKYVGKGLPFFPTNYVIASKGKFFDGEEMISIALIIETRKLSAKSRFNRILDAIRNSGGKYGDINFLYTTTTHIKKLMTTYDKKYMKLYGLSIAEIVNHYYERLDEITKNFESNHRNDGGFNLPGLIKYSRMSGTPVSIAEIVVDVVGFVTTYCNWQTDRDKFKFRKIMNWMFGRMTPNPEPKKSSKKSTDKFIPAKMLVTEKKKRNRQANWE